MSSYGVWYFYNAARTTDNQKKTTSTTHSIKNNAHTQVYREKNDAMSTSSGERENVDEEQKKRLKINIIILT